MKKMLAYSLVVGFMFVAGSAKAELNSRWISPSNGWEVTYLASDGVLPENATPAWNKYNFQSYMISNVVDAISGENTLQLIMTNSASPWTYSNYQQTNVVFTTNDTITCDIRFRLTDMSQLDGMNQISFAFNCPRTDGVAGRDLYYIKFSKIGISYLNDGITYYRAAPISNTWHELRMLIDAKVRSARVYLDDAPDAICTFTSLRDSNELNYMMFGDGSGGIQGKANVSYIKFTNDEIVEPARYTHYGNNDPKTEYWTYNSNGVGVVWNAGSDDGTDYWQGVDDGHNYGFYRGWIPNSMKTNTWTASCKLRVPAASTPAYAVTMNPTDDSNQWVMNFTHDAVYYQNQSGSYIKISDIIHPDKFHVFQIYYDQSGDGGNGTASYYIDGYLKTTLTRSDVTGGGTAGSISWGSINSGASSTQQWNWVQFAPGNQVIDPIPPLGTVVTIK